MAQMKKNERPPEGTVRPWKVNQAKKKIFRLVDDPAAIAVASEALLNELYPDDDPSQKIRLKIVSVSKK